MKSARKISFRLRRLKAIGRAAGVASLVVAVAGGVTFAALQSQPAKLTGNNIQTASANLQVSIDGINFSATEPGFVFTGIIPGGSPMPQPGYNVTLKNTGNAPLALKLAVSNNPSNLENVDFSKVSVILTPNGGNPQSMTLKSLIDSSNNGGLVLNTASALAPGNRQTFSLQISMAADALSGTSANIGNFDFAFTGVATSN